MRATIREMAPGDWSAVAEIYREGIATGNATFEAVVPSHQAWDAAHRGDARLVAEMDGDAVGWAALSPVSSRPAYAGVAEVSVYVARRARGRGIGRVLLEALVETSERAGVWTLQAGVFPENQASIAIHRACGFREVGVRERLGRTSDGRWRDVVLLERRSDRVGRPGGMA